MRTYEEWVDPSGQTYYVHPSKNCEGERCLIHNPTDHIMRDWPIVLRETGLIERTCSHGIGHPDPDSVDYLNRTIGKGWGVHGCDGCCAESPSSNG